MNPSCINMLILYIILRRKMMKIQNITVMIYIIGLFFILNVWKAATASDFYAYYTRLDLEDDISGKYADIVVRFGPNKQFVFSRETSYLPFWETKQGKWTVEEIIPRAGNGPSGRPDEYCWYSHVRIIENTPNKIVIHWRYMPNFANLEWDGVVDEYFTITRDFIVRRSIRQGTEKLDAWNDPSNLIVQMLRLKEQAIEEIGRKKVNSVKSKPLLLSVSPIRKNKVSTPGIEFSFDEGINSCGDTVHETISGYECAVEGHKTLWKTGISGTSLAFDGYYSTVRFPYVLSPSFKDEITVEAWFAPGAYPFDWAPVAHQSEWGKSGFYLGINENGYPGFHAAIDDRWLSVVDSTHLELFKWYYITGTYEKEAGALRVFVNGIEKGITTVTRENVQWSEADFLIGLNNQKMPAIEGRIRVGKWPSLFGIDGLIDEVRIYDRALSNNMKSEYKPFNIYPTDSEVETFPGHNRRSHFHWWNHWPVSQITSDGRSATAADRAAHSSLVWGIPSKDYLIYGFSKEPAEKLIPLATSWNHPPPIKKCVGCRSEGYRQEERAYHFARLSDKMFFVLDGNEVQPVVNPCFVVRNWKLRKRAVVKIDGKIISSGKMLRQGLIWDTDGKRKLAVWLKKKTEKPVHVEILVN